MTTADNTRGVLRHLTTCRHCKASIWIGRLGGVAVPISAVSEGPLGGYDERDLLIVKKAGIPIAGTTSRTFPTLEPAQSLFHQGEQVHVAHFCAGMAPEPGNS